MVKLRYCAKCVKLFLLAILLILIWGAIWMQSSVHSLAFAKPWILESLNPKDAPYNVQFNEVSIDWRNLTQFGRLNITDVSFAKRDGAVFAQLPQIYATIDPLGFLPRRTMLNKVILRGPNLFLTHDVNGEYLFGFEGAESSVPLSDLTGQEATETKPSKAPIRLPFRDFVLEGASIKFYDERSDSRVSTADAQLRIFRRYGRYHGLFSMPFDYGEDKGSITARLAPNTGRKDYRLDITAKNIPGKLACALSACPDEKIKIEGLFSGNARIGAASNGAIGAVWAHVNTDDAKVTAPEFFEKPLKLGKSEVIASYDADKSTVMVNDSKIALEDTNVTLKATVHKEADGWHADGSGAASRLEVTQLYKYWPIAMSKDSRAWVTSKMKAGHATGTAEFHVTPEDIEKGELSDASLSADVDTRDTTFEYLPGFPYIEHMNGLVHFTGTTVKINGTAGTMLGGTKINKATLWCPDLLNPKNPMVADLSVEMPVTDAVQLLDISTFTFDDMLKLDSKRVRGYATSDMTLKFNAFSGNTDSDPNAIHLDAIEYDISVDIKNFAQDKVYGTYNVKSLNGVLKADVTSTGFKGVVALGDAPPAQVDFAMQEAKPLTLEVRPVSLTSKEGKPIASTSGNDFKLVYQKTDRPEYTVEGKRLDVTVSYGSSENSLLKDFPAMKLTVNLDELILAKDLPFTRVKGALDCTKIRCESAHFVAYQGKSPVNADITRVNGQRQLVITTEDAGAFLKGLDVTDRMTGGRLELSGVYDDTKTPAPYNGKFAIHSFTLKNSQILGRILSIGSLTGLANALTGSGISFDKMIANINARAGVITIGDGRANGNAMGITLNGTVDTTTTKLALKGVVVPAYALNSMLGKIPIIGALAGGEGEGLIAFNYSVGGTYTDPDVGVNPLSGLTPGFLRGIFGIFNQSPDDKKSIDRTQQPSPKFGPNVPQGNTVKR